MGKYRLLCSICGHSEPETSYRVSCVKCLGFLEVDYERRPGLNEFVDPRYPSIFKFHRVMPYDPEGLDTQTFETIESTPEVVSTIIGPKFGIELIFKNEMVMPTGTWKDREGFVSIHRLLHNNVSDLVLFSSGNTGTSLARSASMVRGPKLHLIVPRKSEERVNSVRKFFDPKYVEIILFDGSNDECAEYANVFAKEKGWISEGGFTNYARREGLKLLALEYLSGSTGKVDWYAQPVAGGIGIYSFFKAHRDVGIEEQCPKMLGVQAEICAPMVNAWKDRAFTLEDRHIPKEVVPSEFVRVLRTRSPKSSYPVLKKIMDQVHGAFEAVHDQEIYEGLRAHYEEPYFKRFTRETGITVGLEPATALAGVIKAAKSGLIKKGERVLCNVSGAAKAGDVKREWIRDLL